MANFEELKFRRDFEQAATAEIDGYTFPVVDIIGRIPSIRSDRRDIEAAVTLRHLAATDPAFGSIVAVASSDGESTVAHAWEVTCERHRSDKVEHDPNRGVFNSWQDTFYARTTMRLERTYYRDDKRNDRLMREFAKLIIWDNGRVEFFTPEVQGQMTLVEFPAKAARPAPTQEFQEAS